MGFSLRKLSKFLFVRFVEVAVVFLLFVFMPSIPPNANFTPYKIAPTLPFEGKLALNERLNKAEHLYENEIKGPECYADYNGELYTTIHGGDVVKLVGKHIVPVVKFGKPCKEFHEESICGRPLGLNFDKEGTLFAADAYTGIWKVDIKTGKKVQLVSLDKEIEGKKPKLPNSLAISKFGDIYWTDSSHEFGLQDGVFALLADGTGRVIHYNPVTKQNTVLISGLMFANGIVLSDDEEFLIVSETGKNRIHRYYLKGPKKGTTDIFIDGLPGMPDNLKNDGKDGFFVPLVIARDNANPAISQSIGPFPLLRKFVARVFGVSELFFQGIEKIYPNFYSKQALHMIGHFQYTLILAPNRVTIVHLSKDGKIIDSLHGNDKSLYGISEVHVFKDSLYFGSPFTPYVGKLSLKKAGVEHWGQFKERIVKREAPKVVTEGTKPTTTTPKPTTTTTTPKPKTTQAPVTEKPVVKKTEPVKQAPTPKPTQKPVEKKQEPVKQTPPPVKQASPTPAPQKQAPPPKVKQAATEAPKKPTPTKEQPKVVPVKEKVQPKPESIPPRK